jgi:hypothetical protein
VIGFGPTSPVIGHAEITTSKAPLAAWSANSSGPIEGAAGHDQRAHSDCAHRAAARQLKLACLEVIVHKNADSLARRHGSGQTVGDFLQYTAFSADTYSTRNNLR